MAISLNASTQSGLVVSPDQSGILQLQTGGSPALTVDGSQNVGIGTTSPSEKLDVLSSGDLKARLYTTGTTVLTHSGLTLKTGSYEYLIQNLTTTAGSAGALRFYDITGGAERMRIDSSGRMTRPYQPCFQATGSFTPGTGIVNINSVTFDTGSNFNTSTYRFTAPVAGKYHFWGSISFYAPTTGNYVRHGQLAIYKNGSTTLGLADFTFYNNIGNNQHMAPSVHLYASLAASDFVELNVLTWASSGTFTNYGCYFGGHLIG